MPKHTCGKDDPNHLTSIVDTCHGWPSDPHAQLEIFALLPPQGDRASPRDPYRELDILSLRPVC